MCRCEPHGLRRSGYGRLRPSASPRGKTTSLRITWRSGGGLNPTNASRNQGQLSADPGVIGESAPPPLGTATKPF